MMVKVQQMPKEGNLVKSIFVSSTFKDMQAERDMMSIDVLPVVADFAQAYAEDVSFVDLRWGVDTTELESDEGSARVLSVCLDEIDRSKPYMIILLGERYGWIPPAELMRTATEERLGILSPDVANDFEKSVTALEIEYGALSRVGQLDRCLFYFRQPLPRDGMDDDARQTYLSESPIHAHHFFSYLPLPNLVR